MNKVLRSVLPALAGLSLGAGGLLALQSAAPRATAPAISPPASPPVRSPVVEFFGFPCATADEAAAGAPAAGPAPGVRYVPVPGKCVAGFDATSTLHDFRGWTSSVTGEIRFDPGRLEETATAEIVVDARTLDTGDKDRDQEMHRDHLASIANPQFKFTLSRFSRIDPKRTDGPFLLKGALEILGKSVQVESPGTFELRQDGHLHVKGAFRVRMTQFGITPPVTALVLRVDDEVGVWFELWAKLERKDR